MSPTVWVIFFFLQEPQGSTNGNLHRCNSCFPKKPPAALLLYIYVILCFFYLSPAASLPLSDNTCHDNGGFVLLCLELTVSEHKCVLWKECKPAFGQRAGEDWKDRMISGLQRHAGGKWKDLVGGLIDEVNGSCNSVAVGLGDQVGEQMDPLRWGLGSVGKWRVYLLVEYGCEIGFVCKIISKPFGTEKLSTGQRSQWTQRLDWVEFGAAFPQTVIRAESIFNFFPLASLL